MTKSDAPPGDRLRKSAAGIRIVAARIAMPLRALPVVLAGLYRLSRDRRGQMGLVFGLTAVTVLTAIGSGVDLGRAYLARQQLSSTANLACQYANRDSVAQVAFGPNGASTYQGKVNTFIAATISDQKLHYAQTNANPFTYTTAGSGTVSLAASVPTSFMAMAGITSVPITSTKKCFNQIGNVQEPVAVAGASMIIQEGFENAQSAPWNFNWYTPAGQIESPAAYGQYPTPYSGTFPPGAGYAGVGGTQWSIMGYCVEIDQVGVNVATVPEGTHNAELDCDNGYGTAGNSSISTKLYLQTGAYEFRWNYSSRIANYNYAPTYLCGNVASDLSWANDTNYASGLGARTNQINVYLDQNPASGVPPTHTTLDGTETLAGANLIDECVAAANWVQRSVKITVSTAGYYWLSLAADGANDSFGGQIDNLQLCKGTCSGNLQDNFPASWLPASNGGTNVTLFRETFESPTYADTNAGQPYNWNVNMYNSNGTSGSGSNNGWPSLAASGWAMAPVNKALYWLSLSPQGVQSLQLDWGTANGLNTTGNALISRPFLLVPGYYQVKYDYVPEAIIGSLGSTVYCGGSPAAAGFSALTGSGSANFRINGSQVTLAKDSQIIGVFMSHAQMASTPNLNSALYSVSSYTNPDGTVSVLPAVAPNAINLTSYTPSTTSALLDLCGHSTTSQVRSAYVLIQKAAYYWLTFSALGTSDSMGGSIDDIQLIALGSPYMASAPSNAVVVPVPNPQPGSTLSFTGFSTTADMLTP